MEWKPIATKWFIIRHISSRVALGVTLRTSNPQKAKPPEDAMRPAIFTLLLVAESLDFHANENLFLCHVHCASLVRSRKRLAALTLATDAGGVYWKPSAAKALQPENND